MKQMLSREIESRMPSGIKPMLCTLIKQPLNDPDYLYEIKWDGYRIIAYVNEGKVRLSSRGGHDYTKKYPAVEKALKSLGENLIIDGEVVFINADGKPDFDALQSVNGNSHSVVYYVFDLLWHEGKMLMKLPLLERKELLSELLKENPVLKVSEHFDDGELLFKQVSELGLEGIIAKQRNSPYIPDDRSKRWFKIPTEIKEDFVIGGWIESDADRHFRTLLFGNYEDGKLHWVGHAGGGYKDKEMPEILKKLKSLEVERSPFVNEVDYKGVVHWVKPELVANIKYATFTKGGKIRKPAIFLGFRNDKAPEQVVSQTATRQPVKRKTTSIINHESNWPILESLPIRNHEMFDVEGCSVMVTNIDRQLWKDVSKGRLLQYYNEVYDHIIPYLRSRPLSLHIKHNGPNAQGLYIKDMEGRQPDCADVFTTQRLHKKSGKRDEIDYLVCNNRATLLYVINLGCIDVNPWTSTVKLPDEPSYVVIDLDPSDEDFSKAQQAAQAAKQLFDEMKIKSFVKTSGKTGIHIFLPCSGFNFKEARLIAERICLRIHELLPESTTVELSVADRGGRLYLDPNQNDYSDTVAAPYSVRPFRQPSVSTPLQWKELKAQLDPSAFTMERVQERLNKFGGLFSGALDTKIAIKNNKVLRRLL